MKADLISVAFRLLDWIVIAACAVGFIVISIAFAYGFVHLLFRFGGYLNVTKPILLAVMLVIVLVGGRYFVDIVLPKFVSLWRLTYSRIRGWLDAKRDEWPE